MEGLLGKVKDLDGNFRKLNHGYALQENYDLSAPLNLIHHDGHDECAEGVEQGFENCAEGCGSCCGLCGRCMGSSLECCGTSFGGCERGRNKCCIAVSSGCTLCCSDAGEGFSNCTDDIGISGFACYGVFGAITAWLLGTSCGAVSSPCCPSYAALSSQAAQCSSQYGHLTSTCSSCGSSGTTSSECVPSIISSLSQNSEAVVGASAVGVIGAELCCGAISRTVNVCYGFRIAVKRVSVAGNPNR